MRELTAGTAFATDTEGRPRQDRSVVFTQPSPNMRYVKTGAEPLSVTLTWNRVNLEPEMLLRLEIARDSGFARISDTINNLDRNAQARFDTGLWYYRVLYQNEVLGRGQLTVTDGSGPQLISPAPNSLFRYQEGMLELNFQWARISDAVSYTFEVSSSSDFSSTRIRMQSNSTTLRISALEDGMWFWRVQPVFPAVYTNSGSFSTPSYFRIERGAGSELPQNISLADYVASQRPSDDIPPGLPSEIAAVRVAEPEPPRVPQINLSAPANGAQIAGLTALRQQTVFNWSTDEEFTSSRFILSRNANPLQSPVRIIPGPPRTISIDNLTTGLWYWTVEIRTADGLTVRANTSSLQVMPIPLLPAPRNLQPPNEGRLDQRALSARTIIFRWTAVTGANAYVFSLSQQLPGSRRQIVNTTVTSTSYTLSGLNLLSRGTFVWQVQPVNNRGGITEQRGNLSTSTFIIDIPSPGPVQIEDTGVLYGN